MAYSKNRRLAEIISDTSGNLSVEGLVVPTQSSSDNDTSAASTAFVHAHIDAVLDSAPGTLNTLNEIAAALNDDANFNTTVTNAIAAKLPLAGGTMTGNITLGDNNKAIFGAGNDLKIYHDGSNSYIQDSGTGNLTLLANGSKILMETAGGETLAEFINNGNVVLYSNNNERLRTNGTGIDVTGGINANGGHVNIDAGLSYQWDDSHERIEQSDGKIEFFTNNSQAMTLSGSSLGIGMTDPGHKLHLWSGSTNNVLAVTTNDGYKSEVRLMEDQAGTQHGGYIRYDGNGDYLQIGHYNTGSDTKAIEITETGKVGIGVSNPAYNLHVSSKLVVGDSPAGLSGNTIFVRENSSSGIHFPLVIGGGTHAAGAAFGIGLDPEGYGNRSKMAILAEGIGTGYSRGRIHFCLDANNDSSQVTLADSKMCITESGKIGIGSQVDGPSGTLDIRGGRAGIISTDSSWGQFRVANSGVGEVGVTIMNGCTASEYLSDGSPTSSNKFIMGIHPYGAGTDTFGIGHGNLGDSVMHIDGSGNFGFGVNTDNPHSFVEFLKVRPNVNAPSDYELKMSLNTYGYCGSNYKLGMIQFIGGDTAGAQDNFYAALSARTVNGANNQEDGALQFHVKTAGYSDTLAVEINGDNNPGSQIAGGGSTRNGMLFRWPGIAIDRSWGNYPGIAVLNSSDYSTNASTQAEFRVHGTNGASSSYPSDSGSDFSVNFRVDGSYITGSDRRRKTNITTIDNALNKVKQLTGKRFQTVNRAGEVNEHQSKADDYKFGLIAQEVEDIIPEATKYYKDEDDGTDGWNSSYSIDYPSLTALLINAIKEQDTTIQDLKSRIEKLEG
jgi:hypothetical protein